MDENELIESDIKEMIQTRCNVVTGLTEYSINNGKSYSSMTDRMEKTILRRLRAKGHKVGVNTVRNIIGSDFSNPFNPFELYFEKLDSWDGEVDHIAELCKLVDVENDEYFAEWVKKWLVGVVAGMTNVDVVNHQVLILAGGQGIGKTTWFEKFVPQELNDYSNTGYMNPESKDAQIQASECFLINMDELSSLNEKNIEGLKQLVTQKKMRVRKPYGYNPENLVKRASFCGSTNEDQFLHDYTGNRRFLCFKALDVNLEALKEIDIDKVYAQAFALLNDGFQYWFDKNENLLIEENNKLFVVQTTEEEAIMQRFTPCPADENGPTVLKWTATDVTISLDSHGLLRHSTATVQKVGKSLKKLGYHSYKSSGRMLYKLKIK